MVSEIIHLIGAGGHGRVVLDALLKSGVAAGHIRVRDDNTTNHRPPLLNHPVASPAIPADPAGTSFHVAIGNGTVRKQLHERMEQLGAMALTVYHPAASASPFSTIGGGTLVAAMAVIGPSTTLGKGVIVNHAAVVDHDCVVGAFSHISANATLNGGTRIGELVMIGSGAVVLPMVKIGDGAVVGAGVVVTEDIAAGTIVPGVAALSKK